MVITPPISQRKKRIALIEYFYANEVKEYPDKTLRNLDAYGFTELEKRKVKVILKNYSKFVSLIQKFLKTGWNWDRILPLEKAVLIVGAFQLSYLDKGIVINEMVNYSKKYILDGKEKYINHILQRISDYYDKKKSVKKNV